jgi:hypothetical protein
MHKMPIIQPISPSNVKKIPQPDVGFPPAWLWLVDELIPEHVKRHYSPRESWKDKPFSTEDVRFFSKGVLELSELFTTERSSGFGSRLPNYFLHPKFRSAYLLYFLPLQMAKFVTLFERHPEAVDAALDHGRKQGKLVVADLGSGPGTASLAFLLLLLARRGELPPIELIWFDLNRTVMEDGKALAEALASQFPRLRGKLTIRTHVDPWWTAPRALATGLEPGMKCSLILLGHVLNETRQIPGSGKPRKENAPLDPENDPDNGYENGEGEGEVEAQATSEKNLHPIWQELWDVADGGGVLMVEPASKGASQNLSRLRDQLISDEVVAPEASSIWGPCLHAEACPVARGRDWCHFSVPVKVPSKWFRMFSEALGSERQWLKYSYLWLASKAYPGPQHDPRMRRVLSDPMSASKEQGEVLLCEPGHPGRVMSPARDPLWRGDLIYLRGK